MTKSATPRKTAPRTGKTPRTEAPNSATAPEARVVVRHYCEGIGDCHLLRFPRDQGGDFWMLIDCGVHSSVKGGADMMRRVAADIRAQTSRLDVVVVTHEHIDHLSGFLSAAETFADIEVGEVWMGWTENPSDPQARELDKYKGQALAALQGASARLDAAQGMSPHLDGLRAGLEALMGFNFGIKGERVRQARDAAAALARDKPRYLEPSDPPLTLPGLPNLRIYVLGPPRDARLLGLTERASEMYGFGAKAGAAAGSGWPAERALTSAFGARSGTAPDAFDRAAPFDPNIGTPLSTLAPLADGKGGDALTSFVRDHYFGPSPEAVRRESHRHKAEDPLEHDQSWRRIDHDWLGASADLAMQLNSRTNNTSVVLAFEFIDTGRVLLFAADAQVGNWLSWQNTQWQVNGAEVTGPDLLARTVYYKVGHHGSHNATLKGKGLDLMTNADLSAFIPTNEADAKKVGWGQMPFAGILAALEERCGGRVLRADDPWVADPSTPLPFSAPTGSIRALNVKKKLWIEVQLG